MKTAVQQHSTAVKLAQNTENPNPALPQGRHAMHQRRSLLYANSRDSPASHKARLIILCPDNHL